MPAVQGLWPGSLYGSECCLERRREKAEKHGRIDWSAAAAAVLLLLLLSRVLPASLRASIAQCTCVSDPFPVCTLVVLHDH